MTGRLLLLMPTVLVFLLSSAVASSSPQFPDGPPFTYTAEDYETTEVQIGQLRAAIWYQEMYFLAREAYEQKALIATRALAEADRISIQLSGEILKRKVATAATIVALVWAVVATVIR